MELILGSQSPRRRELLERMGLRFRVLTAEIDETKYETEDPESSVRRICEAKAAAVAERMQYEATGNRQQATGDGGCGLPRQCAHWLAMTESEAGPAAGNAADVTCHLSPVTCHLILTADTIVVLDGRIMGKPHDEAEARAMLRSLSGREHAVYTAFALLPVKASGIRDQASGDGGCEASGIRHQASGDGGCEASGIRDQASGDEGCEASGVRQQASGDGGCEASGVRQQAPRDASCHLSPVTCQLSPVTCHLSPAASAAFTHCEKTFVKFRPLTEAEIDAYVATGEPMDKAGAYGIQGRGMLLVEGIRGDYFTVMGLPVCRLAVALKRYGIDPLTP